MHAFTKPYKFHMWTKRPAINTGQPLTSSTFWDNLCQTVPITTHTSALYRHCLCGDEHVAQSVNPHGVGQRLHRFGACGGPAEALEKSACTSHVQSKNRDKLTIALV
jgi:hypothetical protein